MLHILVLAPAFLSLVGHSDAQCTTQCSSGDNLQDILWEKGATFFQQLFEDKMKSSQQLVVDRLDAIQSRLDNLETKVAGLSASAEDKVILRRQDGTVNFTRGWAEYREGFGEPGGEFWLGLENIHVLTSLRGYRLRVDLTDWSGERLWAEYGRFFLLGEEKDYRIRISNYVAASTAGDALTSSSNPIHGMRFTTPDRDNDERPDNCADIFKASWWFKDCSRGAITGPYQPKGHMGPDGIRWYNAYNDDRSLKEATLTLRPI